MFCAEDENKNYPEHKILKTIILFSLMYSSHYLPFIIGQEVARSEITRAKLIL